MAEPARARAGVPAQEAATIRLDKFLWFARLARSRSAAQAIAEAGTLRLDGRRIERAHVSVRVGSVIAFPLAGQVRVLRVEALPERRVPPAQAALLYASLDRLVPSPLTSPKPEHSRDPFYMEPTDQ